LQLEAAELKMAYHALCARAPRRAQSYLSKTRNGFVPVEETGRRVEERLAIALFNQKELPVSAGGHLRLLDYQFPLKSVLADQGVGKVDLLGIDEGGRLTIVELKVEGSAEDRRIGLVEGLIYAAVVEANADRIAAEVLQARGCQVTSARPRFFLVAPPKFWSNPKTYPSLEDLTALSSIYRYSALTAQTRLTWVWTEAGRCSWANFICRLYLDHSAGLRGGRADLRRGSEQYDLRGEAGGCASCSRLRVSRCANINARHVNFRCVWTEETVIVRNGCG
jgi:hypothetical protein